MPRNFFHHHHRDDKESHLHPQSPGSAPPEFTFIRTDTAIIHPPGPSEGQKPPSGRRSRSVNLPDLPNIDKSNEDADDQAMWEHRATILAKGLAEPSQHAPARSRASSVVSVKKEDDDTIQEAIRLHEAQQYTEATKMFEKLADPKGHNNPLSQVLYALSLRHGWGCQTDEARAAEYLRLAASNAADIEQEALRAGMSKGGSAKGELILAIYELANCYRQGWGVPKDLGAAFQYYLTAANLGDTDAMNEVALCYLEGYGTKKDKYEAARYYRLAESKGNKIVGNSW
ncbi:hypothetical protein BDZ91DRAFT_771879 [Kalaharituber pfeilii]|nr:hypothetical protein BDZ91DRAFT_771879 [Kalaharituber pfeilii]